MNWDEFSRRILEKCKQQEAPYSACFELTPLCNFRCNMCYVRLDSEQAKAQGGLLSTDQWIYLAHEAKKMGAIMLEVTGGEATTRSDFPVLYESFIKMGFVVNLRTNGYLISGDIFGLLKKYKPARVGVTLYGASDETYRRICGVSDGFSVVTKNVLAMRDAGLNVHLTMTISKENEKDTIALQEWADRNGLKIRAYGGLFNPNRDTKRSIEHLMIRYSDEECNITDNMKFMPHEIQDREYYMNPFWMCRGFGAVFCITWNGHMTLCNGMTKVWADPFKDTFDSAYHNLYKELRAIKRPDECKNCRYIDFCISCPTQLLSATGYLNQTCEEVCRKARRRYKRVLLQKSQDN